jgi:hypothetical protein
MSRPKSPFLALEVRIATDERDSIVNRWKYGRELLAVKGDRKQLPHGMIGDLIKAAARAGLKLSEREIQRRMKLATVYGSEAKVRQALTDFGTWSDIVNANFPPVVSDEPDGLESDGIDLGAPDRFEQMTLLIPGLSAELSVAGQKIPLAVATVADVRAYRDTYRQIHENFGKRLARIEFALGVMEDGSDGDDSALAVEAWQRGCGETAA